MTRKQQKSSLSQPVNERINKFPLMAMGVLIHVSAHAKHSAQPHMNISRNFSPPVSATPPIRIFTQPLKSGTPDSGRYVKFSAKYIIVGGEMGRLEKVVRVQSCSVGYSWLHAKP